MIGELHLQVAGNGDVEAAPFIITAKPAINQILASLLPLVAPWANRFAQACRAIDCPHQHLRFDDGTMEHIENMDQEGAAIKLWISDRYEA